MDVDSRREEGGGEGGGRGWNYTFLLSLCNPEGHHVAFASTTSRPPSPSPPPKTGPEGPAHGPWGGREETFRHVQSGCIDTPNYSIRRLRCKERKTPVPGTVGW